MALSHGMVSVAVKEKMSARLGALKVRLDNPENLLRCRLGIEWQITNLRLADGEFDLLSRRHGPDQRRQPTRS